MVRIRRNTVLTDVTDVTRMTMPRFGMVMRLSNLNFQISSLCICGTSCGIFCNASAWRWL
jgi:hypothetical protein